MGKWGPIKMRFKNRVLLTVGCVSLLALSVPAFSLPAQKNGIDRQKRPQIHQALQKKKIAQRATNTRLKPHAARENATARLVSMPASEPPKRPILGWPALVSEARKYLGTNPTDRKNLWCATFMNLVLAKVGYAGTNSDAAKSFTYYGHRVSSPQIGAIAVLTRGKRGGHVGVVSGIDKNGNPIIISGNHGHQVGEAAYPRSRVIAYVMPSRSNSVQLAARSQPNHAAPEPGIDSPITELLAAIEAEQNRAPTPSQRPNVRPSEQRVSPPPPPQQQQQPNQMARASLPERPSQPVPPAPPAEPYRSVQQSPEVAIDVPQRGRRVVPIEPGLAEFLGITGSVQDRGQAAQPPRVTLQRARQVQQKRPSRVARAGGLSGVFGLR